MKNLIKKYEKDLEAPLSLEKSGWLNRLTKGDKLRIMIIYEDGSYVGFYSKLEDYTITIKKKSYIIVPECILQGKNPTLIYFYNNPFPIQLKYTPPQKAPMWDVHLDAKLLKTLLESDIVNKMYAKQGFNAKVFIIITTFVLIVILILLQVFGVVDVMGMITGSAQKVAGG